MHWPKSSQPNRVTSKIAGTIDILPTIADIIGTDNLNPNIDGVSLLPLLLNEPNATPRNQLYYYYGKKLIAVRKDKWKLIFPHTYRSYENVEPGKNLFPGPYGKGNAGLELYDLESDIGERKDLAKVYPDIVKELEQIGQKARSILGDKLTDTIGSEAYETVCGYSPIGINISHTAVGKKLNLINKPNDKYPGESYESLINGLAGTVNYTDPSWQGFEAEDLIATIDLGTLTEISEIKARFLQSQVFWIFLPKKIEIEHSIDGKNFELLYESYPNNDFNFEQNIFTYTVQTEKIRSRYVRIKAENIKKCPEYHPGAGGPSWIFSDEIIIN